MRTGRTQLQRLTALPTKAVTAMTPPSLITSKGNMRLIDNENGDYRMQPEDISEEFFDLTNDTNDTNKNASTQNSPIPDSQTNTNPNSNTNTASEVEDIELIELKKLYTFEDKKMSELMDDQKKKIIRSTWVIVWKGSVQTYAGITLI